MSTGPKKPLNLRNNPCKHCGTPHHSSSEYCKCYYRRHQKEEQARHRAYAKANKARLSVSHRNWLRQTAYGLSVEEYGLLLRGQKGRCAICKDKFLRTPHVDHCHTTRKVRGLLCNTCNLGLGALKDNLRLLRSAIRYLGLSRP